MTGKGGSNNLELPHQTSLFMYETVLPDNRETLFGIQTMRLALALCRSSPGLFSHDPIKAEIALRMVNVNDVVRLLLEGGHTKIAGRLFGAYRFLGDSHAARLVEKSMTAAGYQLRPQNPFVTAQPVLGGKTIRITSPYTARISAGWPDHARRYFAKVYRGARSTR